MMNTKDMLPIGSVVMMKNGKKPLMIIGYCQKDSANPDTTYDYSGVFFPEGNIGPNYQFLFNHSDIVKIFHLGLDSKERFDFIDKLKAFDQKK